VIGLLWFDNDKTKPLPEKIGEAAAYYRTKYGGHPNVCLVNPKTLGDEQPAVSGVKVSASRQVMPNHFFVGVE
jgi:hypothetical protein